MAKIQNEGTTRISELLDCKIVDSQGRTIGHVADIQLTEGSEYKVCALLYGETGWMYRLHFLNPFGKRPSTPSRPQKIAWEAVEEIKPKMIKLKANMPKS